MILHLERKFTAPTEIFIADQINFQKEFDNIVFTARYLNNLSIDTTVFESPDKSRFSLKRLAGKSVKHFNDAFAQNNPKLIHGHFLTDASFFTPFSKTVDIPKICSGYGYDVSEFPRAYKGLGKFFLKRVLREYDYFLAMSNDMAEDLRKIGCPQDKIIVHYHGIDALKFDIARSYNEKTTLNLLTIASLVPKKGHLSVLKALVHFKKAYPAVKLEYNIVGSGYLLDSLQKFASENDLTSEVKFRGHIKHGDEFFSYLNNADIFLHPSIIDKQGNKEGIPGALVQAMASGLPVISTYHAGIPEVVTSGQNGILVKENDEKALFEALVYLGLSSSKREEIGKNAKETAVNKHDVRIRTHNLVSIYKKAMQ